MSSPNPPLDSRPKAKAEDGDDGGPQPVSTDPLDAYGNMEQMFPYSMSPFSQQMVHSNVPLMPLDGPVSNAGQHMNIPNPGWTMPSQMQSQIQPVQGQVYQMQIHDSQLQNLGLELQDQVYPMRNHESQMQDRKPPTPLPATADNSLNLTLRPHHNDHGQQNMAFNPYVHPYLTNNIPMAYQGSMAPDNSAYIPSNEPYGMLPESFAHVNGSPSPRHDLPEPGAMLPSSKAVLVVGSIQHTYLKRKLAPGPDVPADERQDYLQSIESILAQDKENSFLPMDPKTPKRKGKRKADEGPEPMIKRRAPDLLEVTPLLTSEEREQAIGERKSIKGRMTKERLQELTDHNNKIASQEQNFHKRKNNISAKRGRQKRANRTLKLMEGKAQALAERNYWKARAFSLGADQEEWRHMPEEQREDLVADFRVDPDALLKEQGIKADQGANDEVDKAGSHLEN